MINVRNDAKHYLAICLLVVALITIPFQASVSAKENRYYFEKRGEAIWEVPTEQKVIALTFDDGPSPTFTPKVLDILKKHNVPATFFSVGVRMERQPEIVKRQIKEGHEIGNHTYSHPNFHRLPKKEMIAELQKTNAALTKIVGKSTSLFRPPGGFYNSKIINLSNDEGFTVVMWSWHMDSFDWRYPGVGYMVNRLLKNASSGDIVLFHDFGGDRTQTLQTLRQVIPALKKRGYTFVTVSELLKYHPKYEQLRQGY